MTAPSTSAKPAAPAEKNKAAAPKEEDKYAPYSGEKRDKLDEEIAKLSEAQLDSAIQFADNQLKTQLIAQSKSQAAEIFAESSAKSKEQAQKAQEEREKKDEEKKKAAEGEKKGGVK